MEILILRLKMAIYAKVCTEIISGLMSLHTIEYSICCKTLTLVPVIKINNITNNGHTHILNKSIRPCILQIRIVPEIL